jgi:hypothetical protein
MVAYILPDSIGEGPVVLQRLKLYLVVLCTYTLPNNLHLLIRYWNEFKIFLLTQSQH